MSPLDLLLWCLAHWWVFLWAAAVIGGYVIGGWRLAAAIATLGVGSGLYIKGRRDADADRKARDQRRQNRLDEKYGEIDNSKIDRDDISDRLRDNKF